MKRATLAALILLAALPALAIGPKPGADGPKNVAILLFPGVQIIDYTGPWEVLGHARVDDKRAFHIYSVAETASPFDTAMGMTVIPSYTFAKAPKPDILVIPGGNVDPQLSNEGIIRWIQREREKRRGRSLRLQRRVLSGESRAARRSRGHDVRGDDRRPAAVGSEDPGGPRQALRGQRQDHHVGGTLLGHRRRPARDREALRAGARLRSPPSGMEYDWRPDSGWARANLADCHLYPAFDAVREYPRSVVRYEGNRDRWETSWKVTTEASAQALLERMDRAFRDSGWTKQPAGGGWRYEGDGGSWTESTRVEAAAELAEGVPRHDDGRPGEVVRPGNRGIRPRPKTPQPPFRLRPRGRAPRG